MEPWQDLLIYLFRKGRKWVSGLDRTGWRRQIADAKGRQSEPPLEVMQDEGAVNHWIRAVNDIDAPKHKGFVIAPGKHNADALLLLAPFVLSLDQNPRLSLQLGFMIEHGGDRAFFGYRFESPEVFGNTNKSNEHAYYHAQPIKSFGRGRESDHSIPWYPVGFPAFPLDAKCGMELIASMLLSSLGRSNLAELATSNSIRRATKKDLGVFLEKIKP